MPRFKIIGNHEVDGVKPGHTVVIDDPARAERLRIGGHIAEASEPPAKKKASAKKSAADEPQSEG